MTNEASAGATFRHGAAGLPRLGAVGRRIQFSALQGRTSRYEVTVITGAQIRQARELLGWEPFNLAQRAKAHSLIVERAESVACEPPITAYQAALIIAPRRDRDRLGRGRARAPGNRGAMY
jgi:hypothetical protein